MSQFSNSIVFYDKQVTIPSGQSVSNPIDLEGLTLAGLIMPSAWTAAFVRFEFAADPKSPVWVPHTNPADDTFYVYQVSASRGYQIPVVDTNTLKYIRILSVATIAPYTAGVNQGADRIITLNTRPT